MDKLDAMSGAEVKEELRGELHQMDNQMLEEMLHMVVQEKQSRIVPTRVEMGSANPDTVSELVKSYVAVLEKRINTSNVPAVGYTDSLMSSLNFVRVVIEDIGKREEWGPAGNRFMGNTALSTLAEMVNKRFSDA